MPHDDELMDRLLQDAMRAEPPAASPGFDGDVMRRVRLRRLGPLGRVVMGVYIVLAMCAAAWVLANVPAASVPTALAIAVPIVAAVTTYTQRLIAE